MKYNIEFERMYNMTYEKFIVYLQHGGEGRIRIGKQYIGILNIGRNDEIFPQESLFIYEDKYHNKQKEIYIKKSDIENYKLYNNMTLKEIFKSKNFSIVSIF